MNNFATISLWEHMLQRWLCVAWLSVPDGTGEGAPPFQSHIILSEVFTLITVLGENGLFTPQWEVSDQPHRLNGRIHALFSLMTTHTKLSTAQCTEFKSRCCGKRRVSG